MDVKSGKANLFIQAQQATSTEPKITEEKKTIAQLAPDVTVIAEKKVSIGSATSAKAESQLSATATQAQLRNRLDQKFKTDFAQKKTNNPVLQNATADHGADIRGGRTIEFIGQFPFFKVGPFRRDWNDLNQKHNIPKTLLTGSGDDRVDIQMGNDGRVHVNVNDKEAWSGTPDEFKNLTIDTGGGRDVVTNFVNGANIVTGSGVDTVHNKASNTFINTGSDSDILYSAGDHNIIDAGSGDDQLLVEGDHNWVQGRQGNDRITVNGSDNAIGGGQQNDIINVFGNRNSANGDEGDDKLNATGDYNSFNGGLDHDQIVFTGNRSTIQGEEGNDRIEVAGNDNTIDAGANDDLLTVQGDRNTIGAGEGEDRLFSIGKDNVDSGLDSWSEKFKSTRLSKKD
jgi:hypothetical protein